MGYQVGRICYENYDEAQNVLMTQVVPTIDKDGVLHHPVFNGATWVYNEQIVKPSFPQCEFGAYAKAGKSLGQATILVVVSILIMVIIHSLIKRTNEKDD